MKYSSIPIVAQVIALALGSWVAFGLAFAALWQVAQFLPAIPGVVN